MRGNLKSYSVLYEVRGQDVVGMNFAILQVLDEQQQRFSGADSMPVGSLERLSFNVTAVRRIHRRLEAALQVQAAITDVKFFRSQEDE